MVAYCKATGDVSPLRELVRPFGLDIMTDDDRRLRDIAKADQEIKAARRRKRILEDTL